MDVHDMLTIDGEHPSAQPATEHQIHHNHPYSTRHAELQHSDVLQETGSPVLPPSLRRTEYPYLPPPQAPSTRSRAPKIVQFYWHKARLPLRVKISPHDPVEGIVSTVKSFYGLYEDSEISFEDGHGVTLVPHFENMVNDAIIHVRVSQEHKIVDPSGKEHTYHSTPAISPVKPHLGEPFQMLPPRPISRPGSANKKRSVSPQFGSGRRNNLVRPSPKLRQYDHGDDTALHGLSDSDAGSVSVSSSKRAKSDHLASAEISLDNIVEGGRRNGGKFLSSELPLFQPPQLPMTASMSSASPQRRMQHPQMPSPFANQHTFSYSNALPSPLSYGTSEPKFDKINGRVGAQSFTSASRPRNGSLSRHPSTRLSGNSVAGILPTPDPTTVGSVISDEDVAWQLMRLGDASNLSTGRNSNSTMDDALSGKADAASSDEDDDDDDEEETSYLKIKDLHHKAKDRRLSGHARKRQKATASNMVQKREESSEDEYEDSYDFSTYNGFQDPEKKQSARSMSKSHASSAGKGTKLKPAKLPPSPYGTVQASRKNSSASSANPLNQYGPDEEDLSSKPRCQRCRKSKKGCDRQRPCQRCVDAGIGIEGCISEDEENGRKGRFGRVMGIAVKKQSEDSMSPHVPVVDAASMDHVPQMACPDKNKKRKRL